MKKLYSLVKFMEIGTLCLEFTYFNSKPRLLKLNNGLFLKITVLCLFEETSSDIKKQSLLSITFHNGQ